jgi:sporulation protein YlmC with PRC-barrel domain
MTTPSGHTTAILASRVKGTNVYNSAGEKIGHVEDVVLDKQSNRIMFAALGFGGFLGMGEKFHPIPWSLLSYSKEKGGYVVPMATEVLKNAPVSELKDLTNNDGQYGDLREKSYNYYKVTKDW